MLEAHDLSVDLGTHQVLDGVSLTARRGEFVVVVGPDGAGKSTLLRTLAGKIAPRSGRLTLDGGSVDPSRSEYHACGPDDAHRYARVARALERDSDVILLDEPTRRLERARHVDLLRILHALADAGKIVVAALGDLDIAAYLADRVVLLRRGRSVADGPPERTLTVDGLHAAYGIPRAMLPG